MATAASDMPKRGGNDDDEDDLDLTLNQEVPLVFVPGIFGSHLETRQSDSGGGGGERAYLTLGVGLGLSTPDLRLPTTWKEESDGGDDSESRWKQEPCGRFVVEKGECVERVKVCGITGENVYGPWLDAARAAGRDVRVFAWDWRRQLDEVSAEFESYLEGVVRGGGTEDEDGKAGRPRRPAQVVGHSTGGLIVLPVLNRRASELFHSVVFAGNPFGPSALAYSWLTHGTSIGYNAWLLSPEVLFTHGVLWNFIPYGTDFDEETGRATLMGEGEGKGGSGEMEGGRYNGLLAEDGKSGLSDFDPGKAEDWAKYGLSIFYSKYGEARDATAEELQHLSHALSTAKRFREDMVASCAESKTQTDPVPAVVLRRSDLDTLQALRRKKRGEERWVWEEVRGLTGDGLVNAACTIPPKGVKYRIVEAPDQEHQTLLETPGFVEGVLTELHQERLALKA